MLRNLPRLERETNLNLTSFIESVSCSYTGKRKDLYSKKKGLVQPSYCSGEFDTNKEKKVNCSAFCSLDYNYVRRKERGHG
jgi:hypothetical protein